MKIRDEYKGVPGSRIWELTVEHIRKAGYITTVTGICFSARFVGNCIFIKGGTPGTKRADKGEYLTGKDFIAAYDAVRDWDEINTGNVKPYIRRQQTPFIALLHCTGIIG